MACDHCYCDSLQGVFCICRKILSGLFCIFIQTAVRLQHLQISMAAFVGMVGERGASGGKKGRSRKQKQGFRIMAAHQARGDFKGGGGGERCLLGQSKGEPCQRHECYNGSSHVIRVLQYIQWAGAEGHDVFFTDSGVKQLFKDHIDAMVNRRNTINNRLYKDDPTIFAWDLMNEPRCDCFPDFIPVPDSYVSCRPECAKKVQVSALGLWLEGSCISHNNDCCIAFTLPVMGRSICWVRFAAKWSWWVCNLVRSWLF